MIIKQPLSFLPSLVDQKNSGPMAEGSFRHGPNSEAFALLLNQAPHPGGELAGVPAILPGFALDAQENRSDVDFSSILAGLMQIKTLPISMPAPAADPALQAQTGIRRAISAYAPQYSADGFRQKIDFGNRTSFPEGMSGLDIHGPDTGPHSVLQTRGFARAGLSASSASGQMPEMPETLVSDSKPGFLAARFESKGQPDAIGYDRRGGTCYGVYQLSSRMGAVDNFLKFLDGLAPEWAARLRAAGPTNTNGREGSMPREWQRISREEPERFVQLQYDFIHKNYYRPAVRAMQRRIGLEPSQITPALREVIWSTAVQHGVTGAANIFERAVSRLGREGLAPGEARFGEQDVIQSVYNERRKRFTGSSPAVRSSMQERFNEEMKLALAMIPQNMDRHV